MSLKPFSSKSLLLFSPSSPFPYSIFVSHLCSSPTPPSQFVFPRRLQEEESRNVKVSVWWDFENCGVPSGVNVLKVSQNITTAIRANGIKGPIQITAFGDVLQISRANQEALTLTGITLTHIPNGGKNSADRFLLLDLMYWVSQNPPPAHLFLISGDSDYAGALHRLRMNNYNILLASGDASSSVLCSAASIMWHWNALIRGESLTGKVLNQPPDGPYGSWYGHYKVPPANTFSVEQPTYSQDEPTDASSEPKVRPIPKAVVKQIHSILSLYPKGIPITSFRSELAKRNMDIDKDYYGHKKFSRFLLAMPNILELQNMGDGVFLIHGINVKSEPLTPNSCVPTGRVISDAIQHHSESIKPNDKDMPTSESVDQEPLMSSYLESISEGSSGKVQECHPFVDKTDKTNIGKPQKEIGAYHPVDEKVEEVVNAPTAEDNLSTLKGKESKTEVAFLAKIWGRWFGISDDGSAIDNYGIPNKSCSSRDNFEKKCEEILDKCGPPADSLFKDNNDKKIVKPPNQESGPVSPTSFSLSDNESTTGKEVSMSSEPYSEKTGNSRSLFNWIMQWFNFWGNTPNSNSLVDQPSVEQINSCSRKHEILYQDSFWRELDSFFDSQPGSLLVLQSKTREQMARNMQKDGPLILRSLNESDVLKLVDMLISEKKWVEEYPAEASPFKLTQSVGENTSLSDSHTSNSLRSIFVGSSVQSDSKRQPECDGDGKTGRIHNISYAGVSKSVRLKRHSERSRNEILMDCQKLVDEILKKFPEGYDINSFRKLFLERYGYLLDIEKLGYRKLASLLEVMHGVKIESRYIVPSRKTPKESVLNVQESNAIDSPATLGSELSDGSKSDESDSTWEELGPVDNTSTSRKAPEEKCSHPQYEPPYAGDEFSDSEGEPSPVTRLKEQAKPGKNSVDSSLIQILDSWKNSNNGANRNHKAENSQGMDNCLENGLQTSDRSGIGSKTGTSLEKYGQKQRPQKSYSFVADSDVDDSDGTDSSANNANKLFDGIIGGLKKSDGSRMQN